VSRLTFTVYLNDGYTGSETIFRQNDFRGANLVAQDVVIIPAAGMGLSFVHECWHEGAEVREGRKYVLRADVLYTGEPRRLEP